MPGPTQRYTFALLSKNKGRRPYYYYAVRCRRLFSACLYLSVLRVARLGRLFFLQHGTFTHEARGGMS